MCQSCVTSSAFFALEEIQTLNMSWSLGCCKLVKMMSVLTSLKDNTLGPAIFASSWPISKAQTDEGPFFFFPAVLWYILVLIRRGHTNKSDPLLTCIKSKRFGHYTNSCSSLYFFTMWDKHASSVKRKESEAVFIAYKLIRLATSL